jgi:hypothetical protein
MAYHTKHTYRQRVCENRKKREGYSHIIIYNTIRKKYSFVFVNIKEEEEV